MPSKSQREQRTVTRTTSTEFLKKRRSEASPLPNSAELKADDDKLSTVDISDTKGESEAWFWNKSANETDSDTEEEGNDDVDELDVDIEESRTEQAVSPEARKAEI